MSAANGDHDEGQGGREVKRQVEYFNLDAKNYLGHDELQALDRIVTAYLEFAELRATSRKPMYMADWIRRLDDFL